MRRVRSVRDLRVLTLAGVAAAISTAAGAADFPPTLPPLQPMQTDSGWYLRGDVGIGLQRFAAFDHFQTDPTFAWPASWSIVQKQADDSAFVGVGVGYQANSWLRFDATGEYRIGAKFKAVGSYHESCSPGPTCLVQFDGSHSAEVVLFNAYLDLGTWWSLTPFIGAGVGGAWNTVSTVSDVGLATAASGFGSSSGEASNWNLAWAAQAGLAYDVSNNIKLEFAVRYLNLGSIKTPVAACSSFGCTTSPATGASSYTLTNFDSLDFKLGFRWMFAPETPAYAPPLIRKG